MNVLHALIVFITAALADVCWARWAIAAGGRKASLAAAWSAAIVLAGVVSIDAFIIDRWYAIPSALGAAFGTYVAVWSKK